VTTLMLRDIPNKYCQRELLEDIVGHGFEPGFDLNFFYLPIDQQTGANLGYAFINFKSQALTEKFRNEISKQQLSRHLTRKIIEVGDAAVQGFKQNQRYYAHSTGMELIDVSRRPLFWNDKGELICENGKVIKSSANSNGKISEDDIREEQTWVSTVMLRNLRNKFTQTCLLRELETLGFLPRLNIDFFYLPIDSMTNANLGYAFVNFVDAKDVGRFKELSGRKMSMIFKDNMVVIYDASVQGIQANWDLYIRSAPINSPDRLKRPLFWPKQILKGRSEAWNHPSSLPTTSSGEHSEESSSQNGSQDERKTSDSEKTDPDTKVRNAIAVLLKSNPGLIRSSQLSGEDLSAPSSSRSHQSGGGSSSKSASRGSSDKSGTTRTGTGSSRASKTKSSRECYRLLQRPPGLTSDSETSDREI